MIWLFTVDGAAFLLIGLVVLATPSPVPALMDPPDERRALVPFKDTRRLLASQFIGGGALSLALALGSPDSALQRSAAIARLATILIVLTINASQLLGGYWKRPPLYFIVATLGALAFGYAVMLARGEGG
jgi:hypothetical protein